MANNYLDTTLFDKAAVFAIEAHRNTERRGKAFPYIIHPMEAAAITATLTSDPELLAAAILHDTVEDTDVTIDDILRNFGQRVADIVAAESDKLNPCKPEQDTWRERKAAAINRIANASMDVKMVAMGDKLSNMRAIERDYEKLGDELWTIFHAPGGRADHEWHYRGLAKSLSALKETDAYIEFEYLLNKVFGGK